MKREAGLHEHGEMEACRACTAEDDLAPHVSGLPYISDQPLSNSYRQDIDFSSLPLPDDALAVDCIERFF